MFKINIKTSLIKYIVTVKPIKKFQYINETVRFLILLFLTNSLSSKSETSLTPTLVHSQGDSEKLCTLHILTVSTYLLWQVQFSYIMLSCVIDNDDIWILCISDLSRYLGGQHNIKWFLIIVTFGLEQYFVLCLVQERRVIKFFASADQTVTTDRCMRWMPMKTLLH